MSAIIVDTNILISCIVAKNEHQNYNFVEAKRLLRQALAVFQELTLEHEIKKAEELLAKITHIEEAAS